MAETGKYQILIGYTIFLGITLFFETGINYTNMLIGTLPSACSGSSCSTSEVTWLTAFFSLFSFTSAVGLFNVGIIVPFIIFLIPVVIELLKPFS